jgi:nucleoside-diphosphate-sugar epimerase
MKVLITGAGGFVGSHVARLLINRGVEVQAIVRKSSNLWRITDILSQLQIIECDLLDFQGLNKSLTTIQPELCIHLAWYAVPGKYLHAKENLDSLNASLNLASQMADIGCKKFVGIGTCFEYDFSYGYLSESSPIKPLTLYAASKIAACTVLEQLCRNTGMEFAWARLFYQYGPFEDEMRLVPAVISSLLKNEVVKTTKGEQIRDFLHIEDVASAIWSIASGNLSGIVNIGSGQPITVRDIVSQIATILDRLDLIDWGALPYRSKDPMFICANNQLLRENTNWIPKYTLNTGLKNTISWYRKNIWEHPTF